VFLANKNNNIVMLCILDTHAHRKYEFLTNKTTSANGLSKKTTCEIFCQKRPSLGGGMSSQLTCGTCRHCQSRHVLAAWDRAGMLSNMGHAA
jgi:hypothetical protein